MVLLAAMLVSGALAQEPAAVAAAEAALGWRSLFDERSLAGWHPFGKPGAAPEGWTVAEGTLHHAAGAGGGDLVSDAVFGDFELEFEWKVAPGGNSGVKYRFADERRLGRVLGPEYQLLDDAAHPDAARAETSAAALYALFPAEGKALNPAGEWNRARIVARADRVEHWLNGRRVLVAEIGSADWEARRLASKFATEPAFGRARPSPFALQDHGDAVWFRALRARDPACRRRGPARSSMARRRPGGSSSAPATSASRTANSSAAGATARAFSCTSARSATSCSSSS